LLATSASQSKMQRQADCSREQAPSHTLSAGLRACGKQQLSEQTLYEQAPVRSRPRGSQLAGEEDSTDTVDVWSRTILATKVAPTMDLHTSNM
jgi:hypothetical protein